MALVLLGLFLLLLLLGSIILGINLPPPFVTPRHCPGILIPITSHKAPFLVSMPVHPDPNAPLLQPCYSERSAECKVCQSQNQSQSQSQTQAGTGVWSCLSCLTCASPRCPGRKGRVL